MISCALQKFLRLILPLLSNAHTKYMTIPTNSTDLITQTSKRLFHELWNQQPVRLLGIRTTKLVDENEPVQLSLFDLDFSDISANKTNANADFPKKPSPEKQKKLDAALDSIRKKYGKKAVTRASEME